MKDNQMIIGPKRLNGLNRNMVVTQGPTVSKPGPQGPVIIENPVVDPARYNLKLLNYQITRESSNIPLITLPFAMWDTVDRDQNYISVFQKCNVFPAGGQVRFSFDPDNGDGLFTWTVAGKTDIIRIHSTGLVPYSTQFAMIGIGGSFTSSGIRYRWDFANFPDQPAAMQLFNGNSEFVGIDLTDSDSIISLQAPSDFRDNILDVSIPLQVDPLEFVVHGLEAGAAVGDSNRINWSYFDVQYSSGAVFSRSFGCQ